MADMGGTLWSADTREVFEEGLRIRAVSTTSEECDFGATGKTITDPGFLRAYVESSDDEEAED